MANRTTLRNFAQKKTASVSAASLGVKDFDRDEFISIFELPENALVVSSYIIIHEPGQTGLKLIVRIGSTEVLEDTLVDSVNVNAHNVVGNIYSDYGNILTETGKVVGVKPSETVNTGKFTVVIEYIEYTLGTGHYTNYRKD